MLKTILPLFILSVSFIFSEDAIPVALPAKAEAIVKVASKKVSDLQLQLNKIYIEESSQLEKVKIEVVKTGDLDGANAIAAKIKEVNALVVDPVGKSLQIAADAFNDAILGKWGDGNTVRWEFKADGTGLHNGGPRTFTWTKDLHNQNVYNISGPQVPVRSFTIKGPKLAVEVVSVTNQTLNLWKMVK